jgi:hypothetical protein
LFFLGESVEFGGHVSGLGRTDPLEDFQRLPQPVLCFGGAADGLCAAQAGQCVSLVPGGADSAGQFQDCW